MCVEIAAMGRICNLSGRLEKPSYVEGASIMSPATRRDFLGSALALGSGALLGGPAAAIEPVQRSGKPHLRLSIAGYSYRDYFNGKLKPAMTLEDFVDLAAQLGVDALEPTAYYFKDTSPAYLARLRHRCIRHGLDVSGGAVGNNFCHSEPDKLRQEIAGVKDWIERYALLGAKTIRIFSGNTPKGESADQATARCVEAIQEACDHAAKHAIFLALENHGGLTATPESMLKIVKAVKHDWFGVNFDSGNFRTEDPYADLAQIAPYAVTAQIKVEVQRAGKKKEEADLPRLIGILRDANYRGYVALEYEAAEDPKTAVPKHLAELRKLIVP
jgi:sugar phosphate isomerase/epimerase